jgi:general stress protein 26
MPSPQELEAKLWKALKSDMTVMLGVDGVEDRHARPMSAQIEEKGPLWFFTAKDSELVKNLRNGAHADAIFSSKGHDLFATIHGRIAHDMDRAAIERLWNPYVAAWFKGGKSDPNLALLRFDAERAEIWLDEYSIVAGVKMLLGIDPKKAYKDKVAEVSL